MENVKRKVVPVSDLLQLQSIGIPVYMGLQDHKMHWNSKSIQKTKCGRRKVDNAVWDRRYTSYENRDHGHHTEINTGCRETFSWIAGWK